MVAATESVNKLKIITKNIKFSGKQRCVVCIDILFALKEITESKKLYWSHTHLPKTLGQLIVRLKLLLS